MIPFLLEVLNIFDNFLIICMLNGIMGIADTVQKILELDLLESSSRKRKHTIDTDLTG